VRLTPARERRSRDLEPAKRVAAVADFHRFQRDVPAALLLIQTTQKEVHLPMNRLVRMIARPQTSRTLTDVYGDSILHSGQGHSIDPMTS